MDLKNIFGYEKETVVVTGGASGIGKATVEILLNLGANVYVLDFKEPPTPGVKYIQVDLRKKESIDAAISKLPSKINKLFETAGVGVTPNRVDTVLVNFVGHRHLIESLLPRMPDGTGAIAFVSSIGGMGWMMNMEKVNAFLAITDFYEAKKWLEDNKDDPQVIGGTQRDYNFGKECVIAYAKMKSYQLSKRGIRINTVSPGITDTPLLKGLNPKAAAKITPPIGRFAEASEQAWTLVFLNSKLASYISGTDVAVDYGFTGGIFTGQVDVSTIIAGSE
jgi:NAD(P)-dependent dehydrogenase (short-subunit alcohol dehydrogenase family)